MFDWSDFLDLADDLATRSNDEAALRTAIGRAYFAAFGSARRFLTRSGTDIPHAGRAHDLVWNRFEAGPDATHRRIASIGRNLRKRRGRADYDASFPDPLIHALTALRLARRLLADLDSLP